MQTDVVVATGDGRGPYAASRREHRPAATLAQERAERDQDARNEEKHRVLVKERLGGVGAVVRVGEI